MLDRSSQPAIQPLHDLIIEPPQCQMLPNGVPVYLIPDNVNNVVRVDLVFKGGRWHQQQLLQALFTNRMLREGTAHLNSAQIAQELDFYGGWLELSVSYTHSFVSLYSLSRYLPQTLSVLRQMVTEPTFPEYEFQVVRDYNLQQHLVSLTKTRSQAQRGLRKLMFGPDYPGAWFAEEADYRKLSPEVLQQFFRQYYHSRNCSIYLTGKIDAEVLQLLSENFGQPFGSSDAPTAQLPVFNVNASSEQRVFHAMPQAQQSSVFLGMPIMERTHPDYFQFQVLTTLFAGYFGSRLMTNIREEKGYTYGIIGALVIYPEVNTIMLSADCASQYVEPLLHEIEVEIARLHTELVSDEELAKVQHYMMGDICRNYDSAFSLADDWIMAHTTNLPAGSFRRNVEAIRSVTPIDLQRLAQRYLHMQNFKISVAGKQSLAE